MRSAVLFTMAVPLMNWGRANACKMRIYTCQETELGIPIFRTRISRYFCQ